MLSMNKIKLLSLLFWLLIAGGMVLRFTNLPGNTIFDWDQENSIAYPAYDILVNHHLTLIGPRTGVGDLRLAPLYTYITTVFFALFQLKPIAAAISAGILSLLTIITGYIVVKDTFGKNTAVYFSLIYSLSPFILSLDRIPWNVNLLSLSSILICAGIWNFLKGRKISGNILSGFGVLIGFSSHYTVVFWVLLLLIFHLTHRKNIDRQILISIVLSFIGIVPLLIFNLRHETVLSTNLGKFITIGILSLPAFTSRLALILESLIGTGGNILLTGGTLWISSFSVISLLLFLFDNRKDPNTGRINIILFPVTVIYIAGFMLYSGNIPQYYFSGLIPLIVLGYGFIAERLSAKVRSFPYWILAISTLMFVGSFMNTMAVNGNSLMMKENIIKKIKKEAGDTPVKIVYDMDLGWSYGYGYLADYYGIRRDNSSPKIYWISYPLNRFPLKADYQNGDIALGIPGTAEEIFSTKQVEFYDGLFKMRIQRDWSLLQCPGTDFDRYFLTADSTSSCETAGSKKSGLMIENSGQCNIWETAGRTKLDMGTDIPLYEIPNNPQIFHTAVQSKIPVISFERNRCIGFIDLSGESAGMEVIGLLKTLKK